MDELQRRQFIGARLRELREAAGLTQHQLCGLLQRPGQQASISRLEKQEAPSTGQGKDGKVLDVLLLEDLIRLYGVTSSTLQSISVKAKSICPRTWCSIQEVVDSDFGVRVIAGLHGGRPFTVSSDGAAAIVQKSHRFKVLETAAVLRQVPVGRGTKYELTAVKGASRRKRVSAGGSDGVSAGTKQ